MAKSPATKVLERRGVGAPTKLTPATVEAICLAVRLGNYLEIAAAHAGIDKATLSGWLKRGARAAAAGKGGAWAAFHESVHRAMADAEIAAVTQVAMGAKGQASTRRVRPDGTVETVKGQPGDWRAAAWHLERKHPDRWGRRERMELTGAEGAPLAASITVYMPKEDEE